MDHTHLRLVELFEVEYYHDLEMWVTGHSRSLKVVSFESLGMVSYSPSIETMAVSSACLGGAVGSVAVRAAWVR